MLGKPGLRNFSSVDDKAGFKDCALIYAVFVVLFYIKLNHMDGPEMPVYDAFRYIDYIVNLNLHGIFGLTVDGVPQPGRANAPLYMMLVSAVSYIDTELQNTLVCLLPQNQTCELSFSSLYVLHSILAAASVVLTYLVAITLTGNRFVAIGAAILIFADNQLTQSAHLIAPENLMLPLFFAMTYFLLRFVEKQSLANIFAVGCFLGLLTLTRPSFIYLFYGFVLAGLLLLVILRNKSSMVFFGVFVAGFLIVIMPWAFRNQILLDSFALSGGNYAEIILAQRVAYNEMTWSEVAASFVYWTPRIGRWSEGLLAPELYSRLGWGEGTYYWTAMETIYQPAVKQLGGTEGLLGHLLTNHVFNDPLKHIATTFSLTWRGIFIGKNLGMAGIITTAICIAHSFKTRDYRFVVILLPMVYMALFHGAVSVSIDRYNLFLLLPYCIAIIWVLWFLLTGQAKKHQPN